MVRKIRVSGDILWKLALPMPSEDKSIVIWVIFYKKQVSADIKLRLNSVEIY